MIFGFDQDDACRIDLQIGSMVVQQMKMPLFMAQINFIQIIGQIKQDPRPMKVACYKTEYTENGRSLINSIAFENKAFVDSGLT